MIERIIVIEKYVFMSLQTTSFSQEVQKYVKLEEEIQTLQSQLKTLKEEKQTSQNIIAKTMVSQNWQNRVIDAGSSELSLVERKQYGSITFTYLAEKLKNIIPDEEQVKYVIQYLKDQREVKTIQDIKFVSKRQMM